MGSTNTITEHIALFIILAVALILRFIYLLEIEHNVDHAYTVWQALNTLDHGQLPLAGQGTSVLFANPPLTGYLYIPFVALTRSPLGVYVFIIGLNTLAVWFTYRITKLMIGTRTALIAAFLIAVNPWMIEYSRTAWVQSLLPFFVSGIAWLLWGVILGKSKHPNRRMALALIIASLFAYTYLLAFFIVLPVGLIVVYFWRRIPKRGLMIGIVVFGILGAFYAYGLYQQRDVVRGRIDDFTNSESESRISGEALEGALRLITGFEYELARGVDAPITDWQRRHNFGKPLHYALVSMLLIGAGRILYNARRSKHDRDIALILLLWFGLPIVMMTYTSNPIHTFYQLLGIPVGYVLTAYGLSTVFRPHTRIGASVLIVCGIGFGTLMTINFARYGQETHVTPSAHQLFALPLDYGLDMGAVIDDYRPDDGLVYANAEGWIINSLAGAEFPVVWDTRAPDVVTVPREGGAYIRIGENPVEPIGADARTLFPMPDGNTLGVYRLMPAPEFIAQTNTNPDNDLSSAQGITLYETDLQALDADTWQLTSYWRVDFISEEVPQRLFAPFVHVFDENDERFLILSGLPIRGPQWRVGDVHVHQTTFDVPENTDFSLILGQYDGGNNANIYFLPPDGDPTASVTITPTP